MNSSSLLELSRTTFRRSWQSSTLPPARKLKLKPVRKAFGYGGAAAEYGSALGVSRHN